MLYYTDRSNTNTVKVLTKNSANAVIRGLVFSPTFKSDGTPNNSLINVILKIDDNGYSGISTNSLNNPAIVWRTFSVNMRNN